MSRFNTKHITLTITGLCACAMYLVSCTQNLYIPVESDLQQLQSKGITTSVEALAEGRTLYVNSCGGCHYLHLPADYTIAEWNNIYPEMKVRTDKSEAELSNIYNYLIAGARDAAK